MCLCENITLILNNDQLLDKDKSEILQIIVLMKGMEMEIILKILNYFLDNDQHEILQESIMNDAGHHGISNLDTILIQNECLYKLILESSLSFDIKYKWIIYFVILLD